MIPPIAVPTTGITEPIAAPVAAPAVAPARAPPPRPAEPALFAIIEASAAANSSAVIGLKPPSPSGIIGISFSYAVLILLNLLSLALASKAISAPAPMIGIFLTSCLPTVFAISLPEAAAACFATSSPPSFKAVFVASLAAAPPGFGGVTFGGGLGLKNFPIPGIFERAVLRLPNILLRSSTAFVRPVLNPANIPERGISAKSFILFLNIRKTPRAPPSNASNGRSVFTTLIPRNFNSCFILKLKNFFSSAFLSFKISLFLFLSSFFVSFSFLVLSSLNLFSAFCFCSPKVSPAPAEASPLRLISVSARPNALRMFSK